MVIYGSNGEKLMATIIKIDGTEEELTDTSLESLQKAVGGYIERVRLGDGQDLIVDEDAKFRRKPINEKATALAYQVIAGDVVVCEKGEFK